MKIVVALALAPFLWASSYSSPPDSKTDSTAQSSSSRGCPVPLPIIEIKTDRLPQAVQFRILDSKDVYPIVMSIYQKNGRGKPLWYHEGTVATDWQNIPISLTPNQEYQLTGAIPCLGDLNAGQVVRVNF